MSADNGPGIRSLSKLIDAALGSRPLDLAIVGANVLNVFTGECSRADVAVAQGKIVGVGTLSRSSVDSAQRVLRAADRFLIPGLIDPHFHMGGSQLGMTEWARALLRHGTTTIATDLAEIYSYAGPRGVRRMLDEARRSGLRVWFLPPVHLFGIEALGTFRHRPSADEMEVMLDWPESVGINEPPPAQVLGKNPDVLRLIAAVGSRGQVFAGHLPGVDGRQLQAYAAVGGSSCHESTSAAEARSKLAAGVWPMMRYGSAGPDLPQLLPLLHEVPEAARWAMFCTDDQEADDLVRNGSVNRKVRMAVADGIDPAAAVAMGSTNPALYYGMAHSFGSIAPGKVADLVAVGDLRAFDVTDVVGGGSVLLTSGVAATSSISTRLPKYLRSSVRWPRPLREEDLLLPARGRSARARVIGVTEGSLLSGRVEATLPVSDGGVLASPEQDVLKIAVVDRNSGSLRAGVAFVQGLGLQDGAVATTYCHPHQNMLLVGMSDEQMVLAANAVAEMGGGVAVVSGNRVAATWSLALIGVFSTDPLDVAVAGLNGVNRALEDMGCRFSSPVLELAFVTLTTIPSYGLTEHGLYDVDGERFVPVVKASGRRAT